MSQTIHAVMKFICPMCEYYLSCTHLFSPTLACPDEALLEYCRSDEVLLEYCGAKEAEKKEVCSMSKAEQSKLIQMTEAMSPEEQRAVIKGLPTQLMYEELGIRLATQAEFIGRIVTTVQESI